MRDHNAKSMDDQVPSATDEFGDYETQVDTESEAGEGVEWLADPPPFYRAIKRCIDIVGSASALVFLSPVFAAIAIAIKLTSRGPVTFRQIRLGRHGVPFELLKFRTMLTNTSPEIHQQYVAQLIGGQFGGVGEKPAFKIKRDPRITPVGRFLKRTSLDELPQFWNVLRGDMTLVGPRPAMSYEWSSYESWHKQRLSATPGITGLWQIQGRSSTSFDGMVKLDIEYIKRASLLLDLKILIRTPAAVFRDEKAF